MIGRLSKAAALGLLGWGVAQAAPSPSALPPLGLDAARTGWVEEGGGTTVPLASGPGDFIRGTLEAKEAPLRLELLDDQGQPTRRLSHGVTGRATFTFVTPTPNPRLRVTSEAGAGSFRLSLERRVPPEDQVAEPEPPLSPTIAGLSDRLARGEGLSEFWADLARRGTPLVEDGPDGQVILTFLARGAKRNARLFGGPTNDHVFLERLGSSELWYVSFLVPPETRLSYRIAPDVPVFPGSALERRRAIMATAQADPFNKHPWPGDAPDVFNQYSLVELPDAPPQPGVTDQDAPKGSLAHHWFASALLNNTRRVTLYRSPDFDPLDPEVLTLYLFDGGDYQTKIPTPTILDNLVAEGRLPPVLAVLVDNPDARARARELPGNADFAAMMARELAPWVARETGVPPNPARTILAGSSYGGLASATLALAYPDVFGNALSLSGSFWWHPKDAPPDRPNHVADLVAEGAVQPVRFFLAAGVFETARPDAFGGILEPNRHLRDVLRAKGYAVTYREYAAGHDHLAWRGQLGDGLLALFGRP